MDKLREILDKKMKGQDYESCPDLTAAGLIDSMDIMDLVEELEFTFKIRISGRDIILDNFKNIDTITALVRRYVGLKRQ